MKHAEEIILHLSLIPRVGPKLAAKLVGAIGYHQLHELLEMNEHDIVVRCGISASFAHLIVRGLKDTDSLEQELVLIERHGIAWASRWHDRYPLLLKHIHLPPSILYWQGADIMSEPKIAFVGSRKANTYGRTAIRSLVPPLVQAGVTIVSGGALGADSMAHHETVAAGGTTIAVLGSGVLRPQPVSNRKMFEQIVASSGTLCSPFPLTVSAQPGNFPARNRIIAGLSNACVVVQASQKSGALITAGYALEQGREVFAVPGSIHDPLSVGCHRLLKQGAHPVIGVEDMLEELHLPIVRKNHKEEVSATTQQAIQESSQPRSVPDDGSPEGIIWHLCGKAASVDELAVKSQMSLEQVQSVLFDLQLQGQIEQNMAGQWERA